MKKKLSLITFIIVIIGILGFSTVALWNWSSGNTNVGFTINGLDAYIIYNKGSDVLMGVLDPVEDYSNSSISTEITLYKNTSKTLYGHIYLDVNAIGTNIKEEDAIKWVITSNGEVLNRGNFIGSSVNTSIPLKINIPLSTVEQKFQIYVWLDGSMDINDAIEGETLSTKVRAEASESPYADIVDTSGSNVVTGTLTPVTSYSQSSVSTEIKLVNNTNDELEGNIYMETENIPSEVMNEPSAKWTLTKVESAQTYSMRSLSREETVINEGNLIDSINDDIIELASNIDITNEEQTYKVYLWLSETSTLEDVELTTMVKTKIKKKGLDRSGANSPVLTQGLVPVAYKDNKWVKADSTNVSSENQWYDYDNKMWANAVLVSNTYRNSDNIDTFSVGDEIPEDAILAYYVWIPRYKYKVFNINKVVGTDSYSAKDTGIDIEFENGTSTTGTIKCTSYSFAEPSSSANSPNETCSGANGEYYTHPAFWWDKDGDGIRENSEELKGIWVGKFEVSSSSPSNSNGGGKSIDLTVRIKPNVVSWRKNLLSNFSYVIQNMQKSGNEYGLTTDRTKADSHMIKNTEWGAMAYLTHSKYGRCTNSVCEEVTINNSKDYITGNAANEVSANSASGTINEYSTLAGQKASTTANIYGIYDVSGGAYDYVMGNVSRSTGSYTYFPRSAGDNFSYSQTTAKYIDTYANNNSFSNQKSWNRSRLGDALGEVILSASETGAWNSDFSYFAAENVLYKHVWIERGGLYDAHTRAGVFNHSAKNGDSDAEYGTRATLLVF